MFKVIVILCLVFSIQDCKTQNKEEKNNVSNKYQSLLQKERWITNLILGLNSRNTKYKLTKFVPRKFAGNITSFTDKNKFVSSYVAFCGNDNFTTVSGKYVFLDTDKIKIGVDSVSYSGEWKKPTQYRKLIYQTFIISTKNDTIILTKEK